MITFDKIDKGINREEINGGGYQDRSFDFSCEVEDVQRVCKRGRSDCPLGEWSALLLSWRRVLLVWRAR